MNPQKISRISSYAEKPIGIFDSGLGGLTVLRELRKALPNEHFIYLGDTARTPYGAKSVSTIVRYSVECASFLSNFDVKLVVVACNTSSAAALSELDERFPCPVIGTIGPAVRAAVAASRTKRFGVIGTQGTIASGAYDKALHLAAPGSFVSSLACPLFVPLVEQGMLDGEIVDKVIELYLAPLKSEGIDTLILGCTHYPLLTPRIQNFLGSSVKIIECSKAITEDVLETLSRGGAVASGPGQEDYYVTDEVSRFNHLAKLILQQDHVHAAHVEELVGAVA